MKLISVGFLNKVIDVEEGKLKAKKRCLDQLNLAMNTKYNPFGQPIRLCAKNVLTDPDLFVASFQRIL